MKKKNLGRIAAASLAAMTAVSTMSIAASALVGNNGIASGSVYQVTITETGSNGVTSTTTKYFSSSELADAAISGLGVGADARKSETTVNAVFGNGTVIYVAANGEVTKTNTSGTKYVTSGSSSSNTPNYGHSYNYATYKNEVYLGANGKYYPNLSSLYSAGTSLSQAIPKPSHLTYQAALNSSVNNIVYFNKDTGEFTADIPQGDDWIQILGYSSNYDYNYSGSTNYGTYYTYYIYVNGRPVYYPTLSSALSAAGNDYSQLHVKETLSKPRSNYFSKITGEYYSSYDAALRASGGNKDSVMTLSYYSGNYTDLDYALGYGDPSSIYYWLLYGNQKKDNEVSNDSTTASVGNRKGWTSVAKYLGSLKNGSSVSVSMNYETAIPSSVTSAIKGKNITVKFVLKNGVVFTINGKDVSTTSSIDIDTTYNTSMVPTKLVKAAYKKNDAVSSAQITINGGSFGAEADVTVKFATKRAGCTAKLYRYNSSKETLSLVDTAKVQSNGKCTFGDVDKGGNFVIILC